MIAYKINTAEPVKAQLDPLDSLFTGKDVYLLPAGCTWIPPLPEKEGYDLKFNGEKWEYEKIPEKDPHYFIDEPIQPTEEDIRNQKINDLKNKLTASDYAIIKIAEGAATREEYADLITQRQEWRAQINELEVENE